MQIIRLLHLLTCSGSTVIRSLNVWKILSSLVSCFAIASNVSSSNASPKQENKQTDKDYKLTQESKN